MENRIPWKKITFRPLQMPVEETMSTSTVEEAREILESQDTEIQPPTTSE